MNNTLKQYFLIALFIYSTYYILLNTTVTKAKTMSNENYIIKTQGFNAVSGITENQNYKLRSTTGDLNPGASGGVNFKITSGFENLASTLPFSISLSPDIVDYGTLGPTNPVIRTADLKINSLSAYGYSVLTFENKQLSATATFIPDTTCDKGDCGTENASEWINTLTYGFGYRCDNADGVDCDSSFAKTSYYKHFPNIENNDDVQPVMAGIGANNRKIRISYRVNISGTQTQGIYNNKITFIAIPNF